MYAVLLSYFPFLVLSKRFERTLVLFDSNKKFDNFSDYFKVLESKIHSLTIKRGNIQINLKEFGEYLFDNLILILSTDFSSQSQSIYQSSIAERRFSDDAFQSLVSPSDNVLSVSEILDFVDSGRNLQIFLLLPLLSQPGSSVTSLLSSLGVNILNGPCFNFFNSPLNSKLFSTLPLASFFPLVLSPSFPNSIGSVFF